MHYVGSSVIGLCFSVESKEETLSDFCNRVLHSWDDKCPGCVFGVLSMREELVLLNRIKEARSQAGLSQTQLAELVGVSRNTISSIETGQFSPTAKLALTICIALDKKFEDLFYFE